ncbi:hypothetical protein G6F57_012589 [Rhizopus arrhizus]|nr:hypothetical protein G6F57_012589 [Rhizopus arrhizus]
MRGEIARPVAAVELLAQDLRPGRFAGIVGTGQAEDQRLVGRSRKRARLDGGTADLGVGNLAEQLAEAGDFAVQQRQDGFRRVVAMRKARAARRQDDLHFGVGNPVADDAADLIDVVADDVAAHALVARVRQAMGKQVAGGVGPGAAGVADGHSVFIPGIRAVLVGLALFDPAAAAARERFALPDGRAGLERVDDVFAAAEGVAAVRAGRRHKHDLGVAGQGADPVHDHRAVQVFHEERRGDQ